MFVIDKRGPAVMLHGAWPPLPIDEWWHGPGARVSDRDALVKKWTRGLHRALQELAHGGSPHAIDTHAIGTPMESTPKHRSQSGKAKQFPQPMFGVKEEFRDDMNTDDGTWWENSNAWFAPDHGDVRSENPVVDEAESPTSPFPEEPKVHVPIRGVLKPPPKAIPQAKGGSASPKVLLLQAQTALKQRVQDKTDKKKKKDGRGVHSKKRQRVATSADSSSDSKGSSASQLSDNDEGWTPPKKKEAPKANKKKKIEAKPKKDKKDKDKKEKASVRPKDANNANVGAKEGQRSTPNVTEASGTAKASGATKASSAMEASGATEASAATEASGAMEAMVMSPCSCVCICLYIWLQCAFTTSKHAGAIVCGGTS